MVEPTTIETFQETIRRKDILIDTNVISRAVDHTKAFEPFFKDILAAECQPVTSPLIEFEFLRGAHEERHWGVRRKLLDELFIKLSMSQVPKIFDDALQIATAYSARNHRSASIVDCALAALMMKFSGKLFLATLNHRDFPTFLFDIVTVYPIDTGKEMLPVGIYAFNADKAREVLK